MKSLFLFFSLLFCFLSYGQKDVFIDKLSKSDSLQFLYLKQNFAQNINTNTEKAYSFIQKIEEFSKEKGYKIGIAEAPYYKAFYFRRTQQLDSAAIYFTKSSKLAEKFEYKKGVALALNGLCRVYYFLGKNDEAIATGEKCLKVASKINNLAIITDTFTALGNAYNKKNDLKTAINYFLKADSVHTKTPQRADVIAASYQSLGTIYEDLKDYDKAIAYFTKANSEFKKIPVDVTFYLKTTDVYLGSAYFSKGELKKADSILIGTYKYFNEIKDLRTVAEISMRLGLIRFEQENIEQAEKYLIESFELNNKKEYSYETALALLELGKLYNRKKEPNKAAFYLNKLLLSYKDIENTTLQQEALQNLAEAALLNKNFKKAFDLQKQSNKLKDSLNEVQGLAAIKEIEAKYQSDKKEQEIVLLKSKNELVQKQKNIQRIQLLIGIGLTALVGLFFYFLYRNRKKTTDKLQELDKAKSTFFANISHEFRTPLTMILGPLQSQLQKKDLNEEEKQSFKLMERNSNRLLSLVDQLLSISKIKSGNLQLKVTENNLLMFIGVLTDGFAFKAKQKEINYLVQIKSTKVKTYFNADIVEKIIVNLLSNALKYTPNKGEVICNAFIKNEKLHFTVKNTGKGLTKLEIKNIFERFYQINNNADGVGIGLALVKELVTLHKGKITVNSIQNEWTTFELILPISKYSFTKNEHKPTNKNVKNKLVLNVDLPNEITVIESDLDKESEKLIVLIVDDNKDVRTYLHSLFNNTFNVLLAENGEVGTNLAIEYVPDLIISDVMMPIKNGIELCNTLKVDERTSHIPIILLTAKAGDENEIEGIKTGADAYVTKPFNENLLKLKVANLLENRKKLQDRFSQEVILKPKDISISSYDEQFLERLQNVLDTKLIESSFSIQEFSEAIGMSRMQLHRKLKALTGLSASAFIRSQRLKLAVELLKNSDVNVSQVGYSVGFNDHAYFSKCFKDLYGCSPTEFSQTS